MTIGLVGRKRGMSRLFTEDGRSVPVTLIEASPNRVTQVKTDENDGYTAIQVTAGEKRAALVNKPLSGHYAKANVVAGRGLWEFRVDAESLDKYPVGSAVSIDQVFEVGQKVDVAGTTKGKGFQGTVKRHGYSMGDATHGNSLAHRAGGSLGQVNPSRVFPGKPMSGQMGNVRRTAMNLEVVHVDTERNLIAIRGAVPGAPGGHVIVRPAIKAVK